jgi:hypothetical protein
MTSSAVSQPPFACAPASMFVSIGAHAHAHAHERAPHLQHLQQRHMQMLIHQQQQQQRQSHVQPRRHTAFHPTAGYYTVVSIHPPPPPPAPRVWPRKPTPTPTPLYAPIPIPPTQLSAHAPRVWHAPKDGGTIVEETLPYHAVVGDGFIEYCGYRLPIDLGLYDGKGDRKI